MRLIILFTVCLITVGTFNHVIAQDRYWVFLKDKSGVDFDPVDYFDQKALERRARQNIPIINESDFPLREDYISQVNMVVDSITSKSRWFNALGVSATRDQIAKVKTLSCVSAVQPIYLSTYLTGKEYDAKLTTSMIEFLEGQIDHLKGKSFINKGIDGSGIRIAVFDGGFPNANTCPALQHLYSNNRVLKVYDFTKNAETVYRSTDHGTMVTSCIGGMIDNINIGLATGAEYMFAKTEVNTEPFSEEENWLKAAEWADKNGADIINSSLGYTFTRYFTEDMDGKKSLVVRAANMAASKGILVVNAAGNDGSSKWKFVGTPADADSVLSIGGLDPVNQYHISFSSYGPTADKRLKPNVIAYGEVIAAGKNKLETVQGTSFSSPLVAGFAACAWQTNRDLTNMELFHEIEKSATLYPYFDYAHGYGVPQADYFVSGKPDQKEPTFDFITTQNNFSVKVLIKDTTESKDYLYYHIMKTDGTLAKYGVIKVTEEKPFSFAKSRMQNGDVLQVSYKGYTKSIEK